MISRERRAEIRRRVGELGGAALIDSGDGVYATDVIGLLDYADERDQACLILDENCRLLHNAWERAEKAERERDEIEQAADPDRRRPESVSLVSLVKWHKYLAGVRDRILGILHGQETEDEAEADETVARILRERDEAVVLLRAALKFVLEPSTVNVHSIDFVGSRDDLARRIDALLRRVGGSDE